MDVFVAGAGALGVPTAQALLAAGHRVRGTARGAEKAARLRALGAEAVAVDLFGARALDAASMAKDKGSPIVALASDDRFHAGGYAASASQIRLR